MAEYTEKYNLKKPEVNDFVDINDLNGNMDIIDEALKQHDDEFKKKSDKTEISNPNLLDNWYFADPINQRGKNEYKNGEYAIDRWKLSSTSEQGSTTLSVESDGIKINFTNMTEGVYQKNLIYHFIESSQIPQGTYTLSFLYTSNCTIRPFLTKDSVLPGFKDFPASDVPAIATITCVVPNNESRLDVSIQTNAKEDVEVKLIAAKLELGDRQTLARQEGGKWVLNDPPPDKALELAKCQRYYQRYKNFSFSLTDILSGEKARGNSVLFPVQFRITPAMKINEGSNGYYGSTSEYKYIRDISSFNTFMLNESLMVIQTSDSELANLSVRLYDVEFSADI